MLRLSGRDRALFASDIHLGDHDASTARLFFEALTREAADATHVFVLGDLFEAWIGDDQDDPIVERTARALQALSTGRSLCLMRGNRDFLLDVPGAAERRFSERVGARLLDDPTRVDLFGCPTLLSHGDAWCTDDVRYQAFRCQSRDPAWQQAFVGQPIAERQSIALQLRAQSEREKQDKAAHLMDVNVDAVGKAGHAHRVSAIIHGHTHRPDCHRQALPDGATLVRWVLPDWDGETGRGGFLRVDRDGWHRVGW